MIVDDQHLQLHEAAQLFVLSIDGLSFDLLPPKSQKRLQDLAMYCGCSHVSWFSTTVRLRGGEEDGD